MSTFPTTSTEIPDGYAGWLILFDELPSAPLTVQAAAYRIILDKEVGEHKLHEKVFMMAAGNLKSDKAIVNRIGTAMQSRLVHLTMGVNLKGFLKHAEMAEYDHRVRSFIAFRPALLHSFDPNHDDSTFACPRTWEFVSKIIKGVDTLDDFYRPTIVGTVGKGAALEFLSFCKIYTMLPSIEEIIANPAGFDIPNEPGVMFAISGLINAHLTVDNVDHLMIALLRLPPEHQVIALNNALIKNIDLLSTPAIKQWYLANLDNVI